MLDDLDWFPAGSGVEAGTIVRDTETAEQHPAGCHLAAVLSHLVKKVFTIERIAALGDASAASLKSLGYRNMECRTGNGYDGWSEHTPYDAIFVTAAASHISHTLIEQLKSGGRLVIPVGLPHMPQELILVEKDDQGEIHSRNILGVAFVPLQEEHPGQP